jgi:hypothetical protein
MIWSLFRRGEPRYLVHGLDEQPVYSTVIYVHGDCCHAQPDQLPRYYKFSVEDPVLS